MEPRRVAVFSGAGLSVQAPAGLPGGYALRDRVLDLMQREAHAYAGTVVTDAQHARMQDPARKLEQVLGRLWRIVGDEAMGCLQCLTVEVPNEAHMLSALHLARGGTHVTVNLDRGIELAYELITGVREPREPFRAHVARWRQAAGTVGPLRVVTRRRDFDDWLADGSPPALLKIHGGLAPDGHGLLDVVVEDTEELGGLHPSRLAAVRTLRTADALLVTGYGGVDPDIYAWLLEAASATASRWVTLDGGSVRDELRSHGIELAEGDPDGLAVTALRAVLAEDDLAWPAVPVAGPGWEAGFTRWERSLAADPVQFALAWAWLLADAGQRDDAIDVLRQVLKREPSERARLRLADALYDRAERNDRRHALREYSMLAVSRSLEWPTRAHALLRIGGVARGLAVRRGGALAAPLVPLAMLAPAIVLAEQRRRGRDADQETTAAAHAVLGQNALRFAEAAMLRGLSRLAAAPLQWAAGRCAQASELTANGNRRALTRSHTLLALGLRALAVGADADPAWHDELERLVATYRNAGDLAGAGNCLATLAVLDMVAGDRAGVDQRLADARHAYAEGRDDGRLIPSGAALLERLGRLFERVAGRARAGRQRVGQV